MAIPPVKVPITADTSGLDAGLNSATGRLQSFAAGLLTPVGAAKAMGAAVTAAGVAVVALTRSSLQNVDELTKQARSLGLTTAAFQRMSLVANEAGVEAGQLSAMLGLMQRNVVELSQGTQRQVDTFNKLGLSISDIQGLSPDAQFAKIAESLNSITDPAERTAAAMDVFGRSGRAAINMISDYQGLVANAAEFQERFGIAVAQTDAEQIERANDALGRVQMVFVGIGNVLASKVAPYLEGFANTMIALADRVLPDFRGELGTVERSQYDLNAAIQNFSETNTPEALQSIEDRANALRDLAQSNLDAARTTLELMQATMDSEMAAGILDPERAAMMGYAMDEASKTIVESLARIAEAEAALQEAREGGGSYVLPELQLDDPDSDPADPASTPLGRALDAEKDRLDQAISDQEAFWNASASLAAAGNGKIFEVLKKINAANALVNAWGAFGAVLNDPAFIGQPWARFAAAAQALSAGLGAVNAIRSVSASGAGGGGGGGGASLAASAPAQMPTQTIRFDFGGQNAMGGQQMVDLLNDAYERGYRIRAVMA